MAKIREIAAQAAALLIGGLYLYAGAVKIWRPDQLLTDILSYQLVAYQLAFVSAYLLPALEVVAGFAIIFRRFRLEGAAILSALTLVFTGALVLAWVRGLDITCGCFGRATVKANYPLLVVRDLAILASCIFVLMSERATRRARENKS